MQQELRDWGLLMPSNPVPRSYGADIAYARHTGNLDNAVYLRRSEWDKAKDKDRAEVEERAWWAERDIERARMDSANTVAEGLTNPKELQAAAEGKAPLDYLEPALDVEKAYVMKGGAKKYGYRNYTISPIKVRTYIGAIERHMREIRLGNDIDAESGRSHWAHISACCDVIAGAELAGTLVDDRTPTLVNKDA